MFEAAGCENVQIYIPSGNAIFDASASASRFGDTVSASIDKRFG